MKKIVLPVIILSGLGFFAYCCTPKAAISNRAKTIVDTAIVDSDSIAVSYDLDTIQDSDYNSSQYDMDTTMVIDTVETEVL